MVVNKNSTADIALAQTLERAEGTACASFVEARARMMPDVGALWIDVAGAYAMFDGVGSPLTQTFGIGLFEPFLEPQFAKAEAFFNERGSSTMHEVCSLAPIATTSLLEPRGYSKIEESVVLIRSTAMSSAPVESSVKVRHLPAGDRNVWARLSADGWRSEGEAIAEFVEALGLIVAQAKGAECFIAELNGQPIAAGAINIANGIALMAGASTIPGARRQGAQRALFEARLAFAARAGIETAMVVTQPGSGSNRNALSQGFRQVYTRTKWEKPATT